MKIRNGFVSNSSTSSFITFGIYFKSIDDLIKEMKPERLEKIKEELEENGKNEYTLEEWLQDMCSTYADDGSLVFGTDVGSVDYIESLGNIKDLIRKDEEARGLINKYFGEDKVKDIKLWGVKADC